MKTIERPDAVVAPEAVPTYEPAEPEVKGGRFWGALRMALGGVFFWAFLDKLFGLGFATGRLEDGSIQFFGPDAWINGGSPTAGYLEFGTKGPFAGFFQGLAGAAWVDWAFMLSLAAIGFGLIFGIGTRLAAIGGIIWLALMYISGYIWPENNPFIDQHVVYAIALAGIAYVGAGRYLGFGRWWESTALVKRFPVLK